MGSNCCTEDATGENRKQIPNKYKFSCFQTQNEFDNAQMTVVTNKKTQNTERIWYKNFAA